MNERVTKEFHQKVIEAQASLQEARAANEAAKRLVEKAHEDNKKAIGSFFEIFKAKKVAEAKATLQAAKVHFKEVIATKLETEKAISKLSIAHENIDQVKKAVLARIQKEAAANIDLANEKIEVATIALSKATEEGSIVAIKRSTAVLEAAKREKEEAEAAIENAERVIETHSEVLAAVEAYEALNALAVRYDSIMQEESKVLEAIATAEKAIALANKLNVYSEEFNSALQVNQDCILTGQTESQVRAEAAVAEKKYFQAFEALSVAKHNASPFYISKSVENHEDVKEASALYLSARIAFHEAESEYRSARDALEKVTLRCENLDKKAHESAIFDKEIIKAFRMIEVAHENDRACKVQLIKAQQEAEAVSAEIPRLTLEFQRLEQETTALEANIERVTAECDRELNEMTSEPARIAAQILETAVRSHEQALAERIAAEKAYAAEEVEAYREELHNLTEELGKAQAAFAAEATPDNAAKLADAQIAHQYTAIMTDFAAQVEASFEAEVAAAVAAEAEVAFAADDHEAAGAAEAPLPAEDVDVAGALAAQYHA